MNQNTAPSSEAVEAAEPEVKMYLLERPCKKCGSIMSHEYPEEALRFLGELKIYGPNICERCDKVLRLRLTDKFLYDQIEAAWNAVCPPRSIYRLTDASRIPLKLIKKVMAWDPADPHGIILYGPTRTFKSRTMYLLLNKAIRDYHMTVMAFDSGDLARACEGGQDGRFDMGWTAKAASVDVLYIDDLGKGKFTERAQAELFLLLDKRFTSGKPVMITTNLTGDGLKKVCPERGPALVARLHEFCHNIPCSEREPEGVECPRPAIKQKSRRR